jgi:uncharacterized delta-60 repeat protein
LKLIFNFMVRSNVKTRNTILSALTLGALVACGSPTNNTPPDLGTPPTPDLWQPTEEGPKPTLVAVSATGHDRFFGVTYDKQGNLYATGVVADGTDSSTDYAMVVAKWDARGVLDKSFGQNGFARKNVAVGTGGEIARSIVVQSSGKIVILGTIEHVGGADARDRDLALVRFEANGTVDATFGTAGVVTLDLSDGEPVGMSYVADSAWGLTAYPDDRLLVLGSQKRLGATDSDFAVVRLTASGARDMAFGTGGVFGLDIRNLSASPRTTTLLPDGSILATGYLNETGVVKPVVFKLDSTGKLDPSFGTGGIFNEPVLAVTAEIYAAVLQGTSIVTMGYGKNADKESLDWLSMRITGDGKLDKTYGTDGVTRVDVAGFNDNARNLVSLPDGRLLGIGGGRPVETNVDAMLAVLSRDGKLDTNFNKKGYAMYDLGGAADFFWGVALSPDGKNIATVGVKGVGMDPGNDDAAVLILPVPPVNPTM